MLPKLKAQETWSILQRKDKMKAIPKKIYIWNLLSKDFILNVELCSMMK